MRKILFSESQAKILVNEKQGVVNGAYETARELAKQIQKDIEKGFPKKGYPRYVQGNRIRWSYSDYIKIVYVYGTDASAYLSTDDYIFDEKRNRVKCVTIGINPERMKFGENGNVQETLAHELSHAYNMIQMILKKKGDASDYQQLASYELDNMGTEVQRLLYFLNPEEDRAIVSSLYTSLQKANVGRNELYQYAFDPRKTDFGFTIFYLQRLLNKANTDYSFVRDILTAYFRDMASGEKSPFPAFRKRHNNGSSLAKYQRRIVAMIQDRIQKLKEKGNKVIGNFAMQRNV